MPQGSTLSYDGRIRARVLRFAQLSATLPSHVIEREHSDRANRESKIWLALSVVLGLPRVSLPVRGQKRYFSLWAYLRKMCSIGHRALNGTSPQPVGNDK